MHFRSQRETLEDSMSGVVILAPTLIALVHHLNVDVHDIAVKYYGYDPRIDWYTYIVTVDGDAVGFTDEDVNGGAIGK